MIVSTERHGPHHLIERPMLCAELDKALARRLTLIVAQAGAGKSTLLRQWSAAHPEYVYVFLEIEAADDQATHLFRRLIAMLSSIEPSVAAVSQLMDTQSAGLSPPVIRSLTAALKTLQQVIIVIDDAQRLSNVHLISQLAELVSQTPKNLHLVVSSRSDPPIALSSYRLADELVELRQAELAFTNEEAGELLERIAGRPLSTANIVALRERTEGWAAGLQLAGLSLRKQRDPDAFVAEFGGNDRLVADYLGEEVLAGLPEKLRELLLQMSALDDMSAELIHAVTECHEAQGILAQLQRDSMFLVQLDPSREWFRFHHLFRELLRSRLRAENPSAEKRILGLAADWQLERGRTKTGIEYLLRAQLWDRALDAVVSNAAGVIAQGDMLTVVRWMQQIPESVRLKRVNYHLSPGTLEKTDPGNMMAGPVQGKQSGRHQPLGLGSLAAQMLLSTPPPTSTPAPWQHLGDFDTPVLPSEAAQTAAVTNSPDTSRFQQGLVDGGRASFLAGEMDEARELLTRSLAAPGNVAVRVSSLSSLSLVEAWCGNLRRAEALICGALLAADEASMLSDPALTDAYLASVLMALKRAEAEPVTSTFMPPQHGAPPGVPISHRDMLFDQVLELVDLGDAMAARELLSGWIVPESDPEPLSLVQRHILCAWIAVLEENGDEAKNEITEAVRMAEIHGIVRVFVRAGPKILALLKDITGPQTAFRDIILASAQSATAHQRPGGLVEPLTERELEILSYLPTRFSNVELAERCFVSINTIKTHMVHIYRKLDVTDRDTAISKARVLGLL